MGIFSAPKPPAAAAPQPYLGPGRNDREVNLRAHGFEGNLDDTTAVNGFLSQNFGGQLPSNDAPPARGTAAYQNYVTQQTAALKAAQQKEAGLPADQRAKVEAALGGVNRNDPAAYSKALSDAMDSEGLRQTNISTVGKNLGYSGNDQAGLLDYLYRNNKQADYTTQRGQYDPGYQFDPNYVDPVKTSLDTATNAAKSRVTSKGLNYDEFSNDITGDLNKIYKSVPYGAQNPDTYFDPNMVDSTLNRVQGDRQTNYTNQIKSFFPDNYADTTFSDDLINPTVDSILNDQYGQSTAQLDRAKARGTLNDTGYSSALNTLASQKSAGQSKLHSIGENVLNTDRGSLNDIISSGKTAASGYTLGTNFDPTSYKTQADTKANTLKGSLDSDIRNQAGGENLFDLSSVLNSGFSAQGPQNNTRSGVLDILAQRQAQKSQQRGVGSQGTF